MHALQLIVETRVGAAVASSKLVVEETQLAWCDVGECRQSSVRRHFEEERQL